MKKAMRKVMAFALAAFMLFSTVPSFAAPTVSDQAKLDKLEELNVIKGEGHGIDGTKTMTRYRSVVMLLRLMGLEDDMLAFDYEGKDTFTDAEGQNGYQARLMAYVKAHPELNIVGYPDGTFRPYQEINSQEYAKILLMVLSYDDPEDYTWETVAEKSEEIGLVDSASDINLTDEFKVLKLGVLTYDALTLVSKGDNITLGERLNVPIVITKLDINSVSSLNSTTQEVSLNKAISLVPSTDSFDIVDEDGESFDVLSASLRTNDTIVRLATEELEENHLYTLTYNGESYKFVAKAADSEKPELLSAVALTNTSVQLNFSEEVDVNAIDASNYSINDLDVVSAAYDVDADDNSIKTVVILKTSSQKQGTIYEVEVSNVTDLSGNKIDSDNDSFQFGGLPKDETAPQLVSAVALSNTTVKLSFDEEMDKASVENIANYEIEGLNVLKAERQTEKNQVLLTTTSQSVGTIHEVVVKNVKDVSGNVIDSDYDEFLFAGLPKDETDPKLNYAYSLTNTSVKLIFDEEVDKVTAENIANYEIEGLDILKAEKQTSGDEVVLTTSVHEEGHLYEVTVSNITDLTGNKIDSDYDSRSFAGLDEDTTEPQVVGAIAVDNKTVKVTFDKPMDEISASIPYNYYFGEDLGYPTKVVKDTVETDGSVWVLTTGTQSSEIYTVEVRDVKDLSGNVINEDYDEAEFAGIGTADGTAPKLSSAVAINNNTVVVKFNEKIDEDTVDPSDFTFTVETGEEDENNPNHIADAVYPFAADVNDDKKTVTLQFNEATMSSGVIYRVTASEINDTTGNEIVKGTNDSALFAGTTTENEAPRVKSAVLLNNQTLKVSFTEAISVISELDKTDFDITPSDDDEEFDGKVNKVIVSEDKKYVTIYYTDANFESGNLYTVTVVADKIKDALGIDSLDTTDERNEALFGGINSSVTSPKILGVVSVDENTIDIRFDQVINSLLDSANEDDIVIKQNGKVVDAEDKLVRAEGTNGNTLRVFFNETPFNSRLVYTVEVDASKISNNNGLVMDSDDNSAQFASITKENKDPELASAVAISNTQTKVTFSEIVTGVKTGRKSKVFALTGVDVTNVKALEDGKSFIITHKKTTTGNMVTVSIKDGSSIKDEAGVGTVNTDKTVKFVSK
ncbi:hypothetical protein SH1V18_11640 [Vallitalea longa]|uniref:SLH domain-containing protein n=1 Tax=Vallitalea longa TaxID=2936439 RepID=A0A9W6DFG6_9FIRM|nr:Ig-like domain-containing protein [Vallitalea longa]GKX28684.1 hypothetical protein SH1V18_11640 [Vallitalea longa]